MGHGFTWSECLELTLAQIAAHLRAIRRHQAAEIALRFSATRVAVWGEQKDAERFLSSLREPIRAARGDSAPAVDWAAVDADLAAFGLTRT